eukprot:TRINITY_DN7452_c1_g1_i1.p3 TRINITY_DN7452_c1_g1~~TRINITY_DN7452_c1_g1_i1.p3  ORF type:complete len:114 (+),score=35.08 TRINITY_DN7452_c1_g1_i1:228-569(+)
MIITPRGNLTATNPTEPTAPPEKEAKAAKEKEKAKAREKEKATTTTEVIPMTTTTTTTAREEKKEKEARKAKEKTVKRAANTAAKVKKDGRDCSTAVPDTSLSDDRTADSQRM